MRTLPALVVVTALGLASLSYAGTAPPAPDLTGTWTGKFTCKGLSSAGLILGAFTYADKAAILELTQTGTSLVAAFSSSDPNFPRGLDADMCGGVAVNPTKPKQSRAGLVAAIPGAQPGDAFAVDFKTVKVSEANGKGVTGTLKGAGVLINFGNGVGGSSASCKWSFARTSTTPPADPPTSSCQSPNPT